MKKFLTKILLTLMIALVWGQSAVFADEVDEQLEGVKTQLVSLLDENPSLSNCRNILVPIYDVEIAQFFKFMDDHFKNKSSTSSLTNNVIARYRQYKNNLEEHLVKLQPADPQFIDDDTNYFETFTQDTSLDLYRDCSQVTDLYIDLAKEKMYERIQTSASQKRATAFVEKYQSINDRMRTLNFEVSQMFGYFLTFENKLPGFLNECVVR